MRINTGMNMKKWVLMILICILLAPVIYLLSRYNYMFFHTVIETLIASMGFIIFVVAILATRYRKDSLVSNIGYGMFVVSLITVIHFIAYKGMNIIIGYDSNLPTQLWVILNYIQVFSILIALLLYKMKTKGWVI